MNPYKIVFLDIDGTIVTADNSIQESTKEAVRQLQNKGIDVVLATGRPLHEISYLVEELHIDSMIGYNGAYGVYRGQCIWKKPLSGPFVEHFLHIAGEYGHDLVLFSKNRSFWNRIDSPLDADFMEKFNIQKNAPLTQPAKDEFLSVNVITTGKTIINCMKPLAASHLPGSISPCRKSNTAMMSSAMKPIKAKR